MRMSRTYGGNYYKAEELEKPLLLTIAAVDCKEFEENGTKKTKFVVSFEEDEQQLVCNLTNAQAIAELYGDETDDWQGQKIVLFRDKTKYGTKTVPCIRVRAPRPAANNGAPRQPLPELVPARRRPEPITQADVDQGGLADGDDDIPF
jgi:hypothetical protein